MSTPVSHCTDIYCQVFTYLDAPECFYLRETYCTKYLVCFCTRQETYLCTTRIARNKGAVIFFN